MKRWVLASLCLGAAVSRAQAEEVQDYQDMSLEELLELPIGVASIRAEPERRAPAVVTRLSREELQALGVQDLVDILNLVPGFSYPGVDVANVVDFGFRGLWGHEGKILLMVDGQSMNDLFYGSNALGHHYPLEQVDHIEIIRGPGSVLYGGTSELAAINIVTRGAAELHGASASFMGGMYPSGLARADLNLAVGQEDLDGIRGLNVSAAAFLGHGNRSDGTYTDFYGHSFSMLSNEGLDPAFYNIAVSYKGLSLRFIYDNYRLKERDSYVQDYQIVAMAGGQLPTSPANELWRTAIADAQYKWTGGPLTLTARYQFKYQLAYAVRDPSSPDYSDHPANRNSMWLIGTYDLLPTLRLLTGVEGFVDHAYQASSVTVTGAPHYLLRPVIDANGNLVFPGAFSATYENIAALAEIQSSSKLGNVNAGIRYEHNSYYGSAAVPRFGWTKVAGPFHTKALLNFAFRAPSVGNIALANPSGIKPEHARVAELEVGYSPNHNQLITLNLFDIALSDTLVFLPDIVNNTLYYYNYAQTGTSGLELEYRLRYRQVFLRASYSYYTARNLFESGSRNKIESYAVPGDPSRLVAFPSHKVAVMANVTLWKGLSLAPSANFFSSRYGALSGDGLGNPLYGNTSSLFLLNVYVHYENLFVKGLEVGAGVANALNQSSGYIQPYSAGHAPLPGPRRELFTRVAYSVPF